MSIVTPLDQIDGLRPVVEMLKDYIEPDTAAEVIGEDYWDYGPYIYGLALVWLGMEMMNAGDYDTAVLPPPEVSIERLRVHFFP
jgi:hypothetical protein